MLTLSTTSGLPLKCGLYKEVPWQDQPLTYHFKFRWYFQEYNPAHHINVYSIHCLLGIGGDVTGIGSLSCTLWD